MTASETLLDLHPTAPVLDARNDALRDLRTVAPGIVPFGLFLGVTVMVTGTDAFAGLFGAAFVYGGSAQLATITVLHLGSGLLAAVVSGVVVNARVLLYGAALEPWFRDQPLWFRVLGPQFVLDQTYLSAVERPGYRGASFRRYWFWLGTSILAAWVIAVTAGMALAPLLPDLPHLGLVGTALFVAMLVPRLVTAPACAAALGATAAAVAVASVAPELAIIAGTAAGVTAAVVVARGRRTAR